MINPVSLNLNYCDQHQVTIDGKSYDAFSVKADQIEKRRFPVSARFGERFIECIMYSCLLIANTSQDQFVFPMSFIQERLTMASRTMQQQLQGGGPLQGAALLFESKEIYELQKLSAPFLKQCFERVVAIFADIFKLESAPLLPSREDFEQNENKIWNLKQTSFAKIYGSWSNALYQRLGYEQNLEPLTFTAHDYQKFQVFPGVEHIWPAQTMLCSTFALFKIGEMRAKDEIFYVDAHIDITDFLPKLIGWGYVGVSNPQENDLVVYLDKGMPEHIGRYLRSGKVESKFGKMSSCFIHEIFDVPPRYGDEVIFLRKCS